MTDIFGSVESDDTDLVDSSGMVASESLSIDNKSIELFDFRVDILGNTLTITGESGCSNIIPWVDPIVVRDTGRSGVFVCDLLLWVDSIVTFDGCLSGDFTLNNGESGTLNGCLSGDFTPNNGESGVFVCDLLLWVDRIVVCDTFDGCLSGNFTLNNGDSG
jgi:hypothetical protein